MRVFFTIFLAVVLSMVLAGCGSTEAVQETNTDQPANSETEDLSGEVPKFEDAALALAAGDKYFDANMNDKAIEAYRQATELDPDLAEALFKLGVSYALMEKEQELIPTEVEQPTEEETTKKPEKKEEEKPRSVVAFEAAVKAYEKYLKKNPKDAEAHFNLGRSYNKLNQDKEARKSLEQAVKLDPENSLYQLELGTILMKLAQYDEAVRALKKAIELDDGNARAEALLVKAEAGKKRVDFGADQIKTSAANDSRPESSRSSSSNKKEEDDDGKEPEGKKKEPEKKTPEPKPKNTAANKS